MKLKDWRLSKGLTMQAVADAMNEGRPLASHVSQSSIDRWEKGTIPRQRNIQRLNVISDGAVAAADFYADTTKPRRRSRDLAVSVVASRRGWVARRRQRSTAVRP